MQMESRKGRKEGGGGRVERTVEEGGDKAKIEKGGKK